MRTSEEITLILLAAFIDISSTTPTLPIKYTLYNATKSWNEARAACELNGQQMLKLDTEAKLENFIAWKDIWEANGLLAESIWTGLHQHVLTDPAVFNLEWHDCKPHGTWAPWDNKEPNAPESEMCIRILSATNKFRSYSCRARRQVACQESKGECTFERFDGQDVTVLTSASSISVSIDDCLRACLTYAGSVQCVAIVYYSNTTSSDPCRIFTRQQVYVIDNPEMTPSPGRTVLVKRCVEGEYISTAVSVPTNRDSDPITTCFETMSATSVTASEPITASPTYSATTRDIQLSVFTDTQSDNLHSLYVSFNNGGPVDESVFTSANFFPATNSLTSISVTSSETSVMETEASLKSQFTSTNPMYSVAISVTASSVKTSVTESESIESHMISTIRSNKLTHIGLYSSTSSDGFGDSTPQSLYWSIDPLKSIADSTPTKTASSLNVVPSVSLSKTMSESSGVTTLLGVVEATPYLGTKFTWTIVSDPLVQETSTHVSTLDPSSVALSTGTSTPNEKQCICTCMLPVMSMAVDVNDYLLDQKNLSSYRRSKTSASDDRVSARALGVSGLAIILLVSVLIVCGDVDRMIRSTRRCRKCQVL